MATIDDLREAALQVELDFNARLRAIHAEAQERLSMMILDTIPDTDTDTRPMDAVSITEALRKSK